MSSRPYIGVATPQANPTVEIEFAELLSGRAVPLATRLTSTGESSSQRLIDYLVQINDAVRSFDTLELATLAFACTGSSYLAGRDRETALVDAAESQFDLPIVTATQAIAAEFRLLGAKRIAILAPYPEPLIDASIAYWTESGFEVATHARIDVGDDTRAIYQLDDREVATAVARFDSAGADVTLLSGTGMPTLAALPDRQRMLLSSNLCLAAAALRRAGLWPADRPASALINH